MTANGWPLVPLSELLVPVSRQVPVEPHKDYELLGAHWYAKGLYSIHQLRSVQDQKPQVESLLPAILDRAFKGAL